MIDTSQFTSFGIGTSALIDSFGGMVPCKVVEILVEGANGKIIGHDQIVVVVTKTMAGYRKGERLTRSAAYTPPRKMRVLRGHEYRIMTNYQYQS